MKDQQTGLSKRVASGLLWSQIYIALSFGISLAFQYAKVLDKVTKVWVWQIYNMVANENYIRRIIGNIREDLFPALGNLTKHEICGHQCLTFSEIYSVKLYFKQSVKSIILKKYLKEKRANDDQLSVEREYNILVLLPFSWQKLV